MARRSVPQKLLSEFLACDSPTDAMQLYLAYRKKFPADFFDTLTIDPELRDWFKRGAALGKVPGFASDIFNESVRIARRAGDAAGARYFFSRWDELPDDAQRAFFTHALPNAPAPFREEFERLFVERPHQHQPARAPRGYRRPRADSRRRRDAAILAHARLTEEKQGTSAGVAYLLNRWIELSEGAHQIFFTQLLPEFAPDFQKEFKTLFVIRGLGTAADQSDTTRLKEREMHQHHVQQFEDIEQQLMREKRERREGMVVGIIATLGALLLVAVLAYLSGYIRL